MTLRRNCQQATTLMVAQEDRRLPIADTAALRLHLLLCTNCRVFERQMLTLRAALRQWRYWAEKDGP